VKVNWTSIFWTTATTFLVDFQAGWFWGLTAFLALNAVAAIVGGSS
jgi:hypothetical protein